jgi:hypothetical protein
LVAGTAVGSFVLQGLQTRDEFSIRYLATSSASGGEVVIEEFAPAGISLRDETGLLKPRSAAQVALWDEGLRAFLQESELLAKPLHAALIRVAATWQMRGTAYRMWPHIEGHTLAEVCAAMSEPPTEDWLRGVISPLLDVLESLHDAGWLHGNVCPGQILLQPDGVPMLLDTAAVRAAIGERAPHPTVWPQPGFRPPELATPPNEHAPGQWSDLYSLAAVTQFCMNASRAAAGFSLPQGGLSTGRYTGALVSTVECSLAKDPRERPQSVAAFRQQLESTGVSAAPRKRMDAAKRPGLALADIPLRTVPFNGRELPRSALKPDTRGPDTAMRAQPDPARQDALRVRRVTTRPHARPWVWAVAGALGTFGALVIAALVTFQLTGHQAPQLAGVALPTLPWLDKLLEREPTAAGAVSAETQDAGTAPPQIVATQTPMRPRESITVDAGRAMAPTRVAAQPGRPALAAVPAATPTPAPNEDPARSGAMPDNPAAACAPRTNFALYRCMQAQCEQQRYYANPQCVRLRIYDELPA